MTSPALHHLRKMHAGVVMPTEAREPQVCVSRLFGHVSKLHGDDGGSDRAGGRVVLVVVRHGGRNLRRATAHLNLQPKGIAQ